MFRGNWRLIPAITVTSAALPRKKSRSLALDKALWNQPHCFMKLELKWKSLLALLLCAGSGGKSGSIPFSPSLVCCTRPPMWAKRGSATSWRGQIYSDACLARLKIAGEARHSSRWRGLAASTLRTDSHHYRTRRHFRGSPRRTPHPDLERRHLPSCGLRLTRHWLPGRHCPLSLSRLSVAQSHSACRRLSKTQ